MEAQKSSDKTVSDEKLVEESMESDEMLSGSESAEITDSSDKATSVEKSEPSPMPSEHTSGIEITSQSTTSASETPCESASENPEPSPTKDTSIMEVGHSSLTPDSGISNVAPGENPQSQAVSHESNPDAEVKSLASALSSAIKIEETEKLPSTQSESTHVIEEKQSGTPASTPCEAVVLDAAENTENKSEISTTDKSTPPKKSLFGNIKRLFSPPKSGKSKSSSKSLSPSEKTSQPADTGTSNPEEANVASDEEEHMKKTHEKSGVIKSIKRSLSKIMVRSKSSTTDNTNLVSDEEIEKTEEAPKQEDKPETSSDVDKCTCNKPQWIDNRLSLTERPSWDGTTMTDIPSTTWSGGDVFPNDSSRQPSEAGENTSEEAVAGSLASSPDEQIPDIKQDAVSGEDTMRKDVSNAEESKSTAAENGPGEQHSSEEKETTEESKGDSQPEC